MCSVGSCAELCAVVVESAGAVEAQASVAAQTALRSWRCAVHWPVRCIWQHRTVILRLLLRRTNWQEMRPQLLFADCAESVWMSSFGGEEDAMKEKEEVSDPHVLEVDVWE